MALDPIAVGLQTTRTVPPDNIDLTTINLTGGATYAFLVEGSDHLAGTLPDPVVGVFSSDLSQLFATQDDSLNSLDPVLDFTAPVTGSYIVGVVDFDGFGGTYKMVVLPIDPHPLPSHPMLNFGDLKSG